jgi:hypothetical protein
MLDSHTVPVCPELDQGSHRSIPRLAYNIEAARISAGVSRTRIFQAIKNRELIARKAGRATIILADDLLSWLKALPPVVGIDDHALAVTREHRLVVPNAPDDAAAKG